MSRSWKDKDEGRSCQRLKEGVKELWQLVAWISSDGHCSRQHLAQCAGACGLGTAWWRLPSWLGKVDGCWTCGKGTCFQEILRYIKGCWMKLGYQTIGEKKKKVCVFMACVCVCVYVIVSGEDTVGNFWVFWNFSGQLGTMSTGIQCSELSTAQYVTDCSESSHYSSIILFGSKEKIKHRSQSMTSRSCQGTTAWLLSIKDNDSGDFCQPSTKMTPGRQMKMEVLILKGNAVYFQSVADLSQ